jgi:hypothetical protein
MRASRERNFMFSDCIRQQSHQTGALRHLLGCHTRSYEATNTSPIHLRPEAVWTPEPLRPVFQSLSAVPVPREARLRVRFALRARALSDWRSKQSAVDAETL